MTGVQTCALPIYARSDDFLAFLDLVRAADVDADGRIELQGPAAGGRLRVAEHHTNFLTNLVDEMSDVLDFETIAVNLRRACDIKRACNPI